MNHKRLLIYLDDHAALMLAEAQLASRCLSSNRNSPLGGFLERLHVEIDAQHSIVRDLIHRFGGKVSKAKQGAAWFAEKLGRLKLNDSFVTYSPLSRVTELEALSAAAQERICLWEALDALADTDERLNGITYSFFLEQSEQHLAELRSRARYTAAEAFHERQ